MKHPFAQLNRGFNVEYKTSLNWQNKPVKMISFKNYHLLVGCVKITSSIRSYSTQIFYRSGHVDKDTR